MRRTAILGLLGAVLCLAGCIFFGPFGPVVLYEESFPDDANWYQGESDNVKWWLEDGKYHGLVKFTSDFEADAGFLSRRTTIGPFTDFRFTLEAAQVLGPDNNGYGVVFRSSADGEDFYRFRISGDGYAKFDKSVGGTRTAIRDWEPAPSVNLGNAANRIEIVANGNEFTFVVNDDTLYTVADSTHASGGIGLAAIKYVELGGELHIAFDNLRIEALE